MTGLDATIARALAGYNAGDVLSFDSLREAANAAQLTPRQLHGQILHAIHAGYIKARVSEIAALAQGDAAQTGGE